MRTTSAITRDFVEHTRQQYEDKHYISYAFALSHPDHLAVMARLFGLIPPDPSTARILEIGCASGGNLIPVAMKYPRATCLGIDLSQSQIDTGLGDTTELGIDNLELKAMDLREFDPGEQQFDYIICHGVYSWVPPAVRQKILELCQGNLTTDGIAYISYNCYPGWHINEISRYLMYRSCDHISDPDTRYRTALGMLREFSTIAQDTEAFPLGRIYRECYESLKCLGPDYVLHDYLEPVNTPFYFRDFLCDCAHRDLAYVSDTELTPMLLSAQPEAVQALIGRISNNRLETEEYLDFVSARTFRGSLLTHADQELDIDIKPQHLLPMQAACKLEIKASKGDQCRFGPAGDDSGDMQTRSRVMQHAIAAMHAAWPRSQAVDQLFLQGMEAAGNSLENMDDIQVNEQIESFTRDLLMLYIMGHLELSMTAPVCCGRISDQPSLSPLALCQLRQGRDKLTSQKHQNIPCGHGRHHFLSHLDGGHDTRQLQALLAEDIRNGVVPIQGTGIRPATLAGKPELVAEVYTGILNELKDNALLIG